MSDKVNFLAIDLGAESGRGIIVSLSGGKVSMEEIHRFPNRRVFAAGTMYWDFLHLLDEITTAMKIVAKMDVEISAMSVDTWGVDFGLLGKDGKLLGSPVCYRDTRTENIHEYANPIMHSDEVFKLTAYEPWAISSLYQLASMKRDESPLLPIADSFLNIPDLLTYMLTGKKVSEMSIANTSNLMGTDCKWAQPIIDAFELPEMFGKLVEPATVVGPISKEMQKITGLGALPVIATCGHDTSAALTAVPAEGDNWAFLSCGTWSILGGLVDQPVATPECLEHGFTNEYTIGGWYLAQNIIGLWLVQELRRKWNKPEEPWDYNRITSEAAEATDAPVVNVADPSLMAPLDMEQALLDLIEKSGQPKPTSRGQLVRCVLESLALQYSVAVDSFAELTGKRPETLYLVGGGIKNKLLCQFTADACDMDVQAGCDQCTAMGNGLGQALAIGEVDSPAEIRQVMRASFEITKYAPQDKEKWLQKRALYHELRQK